MQYSEAQIPEILTQAGQGLFGEETQLPEPQQEMLSFIQSNSFMVVKSVLHGKKLDSKIWIQALWMVCCSVMHAR